MLTKLLQIILGLFFINTAVAQSDSVLFYYDFGIIESKIQIIKQEGDLGIRDRYTYFKYKHWIGETDTILLSSLERNNNGEFVERDKKKAKQYSKVHECDSLITRIKNDAWYWKTLNEIDLIAEKIGSMNLLYREVIFVSRKELDDLITLCHDKYLEVLKQIKIKSINEIELIYQTKIDRLRQLQLNKNSINKKTVSEFLKTFDYCDVDYKSLEIIIINNPSVFINEIEEYNDDDFFTFTLWMDNFPTDCNISKMKESLKLLETKSHRKNKIKRKIKLKVL